MGDTILDKQSQAPELTDLVYIVRPADGTDGSAKSTQDELDDLLAQPHIQNTGNPHSVTPAQAGAATDGEADAVQGNLTTHIGRTDNPHSVTYDQIGADQDGASDTVQTNLDTHEADVANPHAVDAEQIGADVFGASAEVNAILECRVNRFDAVVIPDGVPTTVAFVNGNFSAGEQWVVALRGPQERIFTVRSYEATSGDIIQNVTGLDDDNITVEVINDRELQITAAVPGYSACVAVRSICDPIDLPITNGGCRCSTLQLAPNFTQCLVQRREADGATQDVGFVNGQIDRAAIETFAQGGVSTVARWYNQDLLGNDLVQTNALYQPRLTDESGDSYLTEAGRQAIYFDGTLVGQAMRLDTEGNVGDFNNKVLLVVVQMADGPGGNSTQQVCGAAARAHMYEMEFADNGRRVSVEMAGSTTKRVQPAWVPDEIDCFGFSPGTSGDWPIWRSGLQMPDFNIANGGQWRNNTPFRVGTGQFITQSTGMQGSMMTEVYLTDGDWPQDLVRDQTLVRAILHGAT